MNKKDFFDFFFLFIKFSTQEIKKDINTFKLNFPYMVFCFSITKFNVTLASDSIKSLQVVKI